jgi:hypothetical protein
MSRYKPRRDPDQEQDQDQKQDQHQSQWQFALNWNENDNDNKNENENENKNYNENKVENDVDNDLDNKLANKVDNDVDNDLENKVENDVDNKVENTVENKVETKVDVDVEIDLDLKGDLADLGLHDDDVIDIDDIKDITGSVVMPDAVAQDLKGDGNLFNIDQVNNLVDHDYLNDPKVSNYDGKFEVDIEKLDGGKSEAKVDDIDIKDSVATEVGNATATADAIASVEAFTQNIVMGANIQLNEINITNAGDDLDGYDTLA